ncbi:hypothetical protein [Marinilactibacillus piezotolerans]|uniref:hypothetical protein n=1 Tax=Marinilactibacillus piezotolerans TaxID=258723 RepID=UPI0009B16173|nr:hypothetical protein [Marinilactibacillus piezotolerans]
MKNSNEASIFPPDETQIIDKKAKLKHKRYDFISGTIILTDQALYFKSLKGSLSDEPLRIKLENIHVLRKSKSIKLVSNRLFISDNQGDEFIFAVAGRNELLDKIETQMNA